MYIGNLKPVNVVYNELCTYKTLILTACQMYQGIMLFSILFWNVSFNAILVLEFNFIKKCRIYSIIHASAN